MGDKAEAHQSFDTVWNTQKRAINKLCETKSSLETITEGDGLSMKKEDDVEKDVSTPTIAVLQQQADRIDILSNQIDHLLATLRGVNQ